jgi:hypothetical protein
MLSHDQIGELMASPGVVDVPALTRIRYGRFSIFLTNLLMLAITLPFFLIREPSDLLRQSLKCAAAALPIMLGAFIGMEVELPGIAPAVNVFLPVIVLIPVALAAATFVKT